MNSLINKAKELGKEIHKYQKYGEYPYAKHLNDVYLNLLKYDITDPAILAASWLHDAIEDTDTSYDFIKEHINEEVADIVQAVTNVQGVNRKERFAKTYPKIRKNPKALILKLADRISNIESCIINKNKSLLVMYVKEHKFFKKELKSNSKNSDLWGKLDFLVSSS